MELKIIQNKLKSLKPFFLKNILVFFPEVALFCVCVHVCMICYFLPCSTSWFFFQLKEDGSDWFSVCCRVYGERAKELEILRYFFFFALAVILVWGKGKGMNVAVLVPTALGHVLMCGGAVSWHLRPPVLLFFRQHLLCAVKGRQLETVWKSSETGGKCHTFLLLLDSVASLASPSCPGRYLQAKKESSRI